MTEEIIVAEWPKNSRETLRVRLDTYKDQPVICCRAWYEGKDGTMKPGHGGLTIGIKHLPALADGLAKALATATANGLLANVSIGDP